VVALHPGFIRTDILKSAKGCLGCCCGLVSWCFGKSPAAGAQTSIYCAISEDVPQHSGSYYSDSKVQKLGKNVNDEDAERLWKLSAKLVASKKV
jgi:hypothetical protein